MLLSLILAQMSHLRVGGGVCDTLSVTLKNVGVHTSLHRKRNKCVYHKLIYNTKNSLDKQGLRNIVNSPMKLSSN